MLEDIDIKQLNAIKERDPEAGRIIDTLLANHQRVISTIGHEIRNPLALVYSSLQLIQSRNPIVHDYKFWDSTIEEVELMTHLLEELSTFNNGHTLKLAPTDSAALLKHVAVTFAASVEGSGIEFTSEISTLCPKITVDKMKLQEVFWNILANGRDAIKKDGSIYLRAQVNANHLVISIEDTGCGISPEYLDTIFDLFQTYKTGGTGLGLAIAKRVVEAHNGQLLVDSIVDVGTIFTILLPIE